MAELQALYPVKAHLSGILFSNTLTCCLYEESFVI